MDRAQISLRMLDSLVKKLRPLELASGCDMSYRTRPLPPVPALLLLAICAAPSCAATWYLGPAGAPTAPGTRAAPWDIESTLRGERAVGPGDTVYLLAGTYRRRPNELFEVKLAGAANNPVVVRAAPGERATIDGGLLVTDPSAYLWIQDLEILVSEPQPDKPVGPGSHPEGFTRPWGGLNVRGGRHNKYISLVIHDCRQGVSWWVDDRDGELHGCVIYDNGWAATDRGHGHAVYTQNNEGTKTISNNIMTGGHGYTLHAYGSDRAFVNNYLVEDNICYTAGDFLVGGGRPSRGITVRRNILHGVQMRIGYGDTRNEDCVVRDNVIVNGPLSVSEFRRREVEANRIYAPRDPRPPGAEVRVLPNRFDGDRAHVAVLNWDNKPSVPLDLGRFLRAGDRFRLMNPRDLFGHPLAQGTWEARPLDVPVSGEFAAFVLIREPREK